MKIAIAQIDPIVGDIEGNATRIVDLIGQARSQGAHLVVFSELAVFGYPPKDLLLRPDMVRRNVAAVQDIASACAGITAIVGYAQPDPTGVGQGNLNAAAVCREGVVLATYAKMLLPTYDVFDETRYFNPSTEVRTVHVAANDASICVGLTICEDLWNDRQFEGRRVYGIDPVERTVAAGAELIVNLSSSPYRAGVQKRREALFAEQIRARRVPLVYVNQVGGNDDLLFDGASLALDANGEVIARARAFAEDFLVFDLAASGGARIEPYPDQVDGIRRALVLGMADYFKKCGFETCVIGLSGGGGFRSDGRPGR